MIYAIVMFGGLMWWLICGALFLLFIWQASEDSIGVSTVTLIVAGFVLFSFTNIATVIPAISLTTWLISALVYFPIGFVWSIAKFSLRLSKAKAEHLEYWERGSERTRNRADKQTWMRDQMAHYRPMNMKSRIAYWISYWPFSLLNFLLSDFMKAIGEWIYQRFSGIYTKIFDKMTKVD